MTGHLRGDARKRQTDAHQIHPDAAVRALIERERRAAAVEALRGTAEDVEMALDHNPDNVRQTAVIDYLRRRADRIERGDA